MTNEPSSTPSSVSEPVIYTIPDKFYGVALKANVANPVVPAPVPVALPRRAKHAWAFPVLIGIMLLLGVGGVFAYVNRGLWLSPPAPAPAPEPPAPPAPTPPLAPLNLVASSTSPTLVQLSWTNASTDEAGFRVERRDVLNSFSSVTSLGPRSISFVDGSVQASSTYTYRVIALNAGGESPASNEANITTLPMPVPVEVQPTLPPAGLDSDSDGLTDLEEPLYNTNPRNPDTDKDSFLDGNEVYHLYNPSGKAPVRVLESGIVKPAESVVGWRMFVPNAWQATIAADGMKGTITSGHGELFTVSIEDNPALQPILEWYLAAHPGVLSSQVTSVATKAGYEGIEGADQLTRFIPWGSKVLVFRYDLHGQSFVNFRTTYEMMLNSLSLTTTPNVPAAAMSATPVASASTTARDVSSSETSASAFAPVIPEALAPTSPASTSTMSSEGANSSIAETSSTFP